MIAATVLAVSLMVAPAAASDWLSSENRALKLPVWPTSVEKLLLAEEPSPDDLIEQLDKGSSAANLLPGFTTLENYPNPIINPSACRRWGMDVSYVCDPDHVFSSNTLDRIEERLSHIRHHSSHRCVDEYTSYPFAVAVVQELPFGVDANTFASELLDRWGLGHSKCHDGLLLLYVAETGDASLKWKKGVEPQINFRTYSGLLREFRRNSAKLSAGRALEADVIAVGQHLTGEILPPRQTPHLAVLLTIASLVFIAYFACAATVISDEIAKYR